MTDGDLRVLCHRFFDAIEARAVSTLAEIYDDDMAFWFNVTGKASTKTEILAATASGATRHRRRTYNDRIVHTFAGGFVMQYTLNIKQHDGSVTALYPCIVALCHDGKILRIDEYIDSGKFSRPVVPAAAEPEKATA